MQAISEHPLQSKIEVIGLTESNYWRDDAKLGDFIDNYYDLKEWLQEQYFADDDEITTHNAFGEYGHSDHKLVNQCVLDTVNCKVNGQDPKLYREIKNVYKRNGVWTFYIDREGKL